MSPLIKNCPLSDAELDRLGAFLSNCKGDNAMNLEEVDGFFAALVAGPEAVMPSEYFREVFGGEVSDTCEFESLDEANECLGLMMRHWNTIAGTLSDGELYLPLLFEDEDGIMRGNDWARGFMRGIATRHEGWGELINDEERGGCLIPMMALCHEHDPDPAMRPDPISVEKRKEILVRMAAGLLIAYQYFREPKRRRDRISVAPGPRRNPSKTGRNEPCPCGSGKKYKRCCGGSIVN
jgi:uncharacterized protein